MEHYKIILSYDGSRYDGWQRQGNTDRTLQGKLEHVLSRLDGQTVELRGAGRTDAGVHARGQVADFRLEHARSPAEVMEYLNQYLPEDIAVLSCELCDPRFHARLSAVGKRYIYRIWNDSVPNVFERKYLTAWPQELNPDAMKEGAALLCGTHDFKAFCSNKKFKKSSVRTLTALNIERLGSEVRFTFEGDGFLYNMVRILTGTLVEIGMGERRAEELPAILASLDRTQAGRTMPPQGLILDEVFYDSPRAGKP